MCNVSTKCDGTVTPSTFLPPCTENQPVECVYPKMTYSMNQAGADPGFSEGGFELVSAEGMTS